MALLLRALILAALVASPLSGHAGKVVLRIRAGNPMPKTQKVTIKSNLPARITTNDIISQAGLDLGYDVNSDTYYVHKDIELGPREIAVFDVELEDVWVVPEDEIAKLRVRARELAGKLKDAPPQVAEAAEGLRREIERTLDEIGTAQQKGSIQAGTRPVDHIRAYDSNIDLLGRVKKDVGHLENLVLGADKDPGPLVGTTGVTIPRPVVEMPAGNYKIAVMRITAHNTSTNLPRTNVVVRQELPLEIKAQDVLDSAGLEVRRDSAKGSIVLYRDKILLRPGESMPFDVKIRDKWNVNAPRIGTLKTDASNLLAKVKLIKSFPSGEQTLQQTIADLDRIEKERGPAQLDQQYVAFYRGQASRLDAVETRILRIQSVLRPADKVRDWGFITKVPSMKTTWMIIYIILGFLAVLTILFSARTLGRTKAGKPDESSVLK